MKLERTKSPTDKHPLFRNEHTFHTLEVDTRKGTTVQPFCNIEAQRPSHEKSIPECFDSLENVCRYFACQCNHKKLQLTKQWSNNSLEFSTISTYFLQWTGCGQASYARLIFFVCPVFQRNVIFFISAKGFVNTFIKAVYHFGYLLLDFFRKKNSISPKT